MHRSGVEPAIFRSLVRPPNHSTTLTSYLCAYSGGSRICQKGADHGERAERELKRGSGGGAPSGVQGQSLVLPEAESFFKFLYKKVVKS